MPFCPNPECDHRRRLGVPAEFSEGIRTCSDCGTPLAETAPHFETAREPEKVTGWTCPECGLVNRKDLSLCSCGYDSNRPMISDIPDYSKYTLTQLYDVYDHIDREKYPDRFKIVLEYIKLREADAINPAPQSKPNELALEFRGSAREYFRIWIVNLCLTLLTFGIFSAWAKVRKKRYFYSQTTLDGTPFQYLGQPIPILKGRIIAAILFLIYYASSHFFTFLLPYVLAAGAVLAPWVIARSAAFNARYSAFRNMTFHFSGVYLDALRALYVWGVMPVFLSGLVFIWQGKYAPAAGAIFISVLSFPWWIKRIRNYLISRTSYGGRNGTFSATGGQFFKIYFVSGLIMVVIMIGTGILAAALIAALKKSQVIVLLAAVPIYVGYILAFAYVQAQTSNLIWNHTRIGPLRFLSTLSGRGMAKLYVTNAVAILASLGLLIPWAVMRTLKYRADNLQVSREGDLDEFQGSNMGAVDAIGAETIDFFDMDLSL